MKIHMGDYVYPMVCVCVYPEFPIILKCKKRLLLIFTNSNLFIISMTNADIFFKWHGCECFRKYQLKVYKLNSVLINISQ